MLPIFIAMVRETMSWQGRHLEEKKRIYCSFTGKLAFLVRRYATASFYVFLQALKRLATRMVAMRPLALLT
jgi:hypothetical protein